MSFSDEREAMEKREAVRAWLSLPRRERRRITREAAKHARSSSKLGEALPPIGWNPILMAPGQRMLLSGKRSQDDLQLSMLGLNRRQRRALKAKGGADRKALVQEVTRRYTKAVETRRVRASWWFRALKGLAYAVAAFVVLWRRLTRGRAKP